MAPRVEAGPQPAVEPRVEAAPLGLPRELAERVAAELSCNETALTFRLVHKATAELAREVRTPHPRCSYCPSYRFASCTCWLLR